MRLRLQNAPTDCKQLIYWVRANRTVADVARKCQIRVERCQCRRARIQRNHIGCVFLVWGRLKGVAAQTGRTVYQLIAR